MKTIASALIALSALIAIVPAASADNGYDWQPIDAGRRSQY